MNIRHMLLIMDGFRNLPDWTSAYYWCLTSLLQPRALSWSHIIFFSQPQPKPKPKPKPKPNQKKIPLQNVLNSKPLPAIKTIYRWGPLLSLILSLIHESEGKTKCKKPLFNPFASHVVRRCRGAPPVFSVPVRPRHPEEETAAAGRSVKCGLTDFIGADLIKPDLGRWLDDVEKHKALSVYSPHEGGYEGRYLNRLRYKGYRFLDLTARGLGDPEATLTKIHPVCPPHLGRQPIARWYFPPEVDYRLSLQPPDAKGLVVWIIEAKVLSKAELQFLALLPMLHPKVKVIAECGNWRKFVWKPLREIAGLPLGGE